MVKSRLPIPLLCTSKSRWRRIIFFIILITAVLSVVARLKHAVTYIHSESYISVFQQSIQLPSELTQLTNTTAFPIAKCSNEVIQLALCVRSADDGRQAAAMLKTVFRSRTVPLHLHVVVGSELMFSAFQTLLGTSELSLVDYTVYKAPGNMVYKHQWSLLKFMLEKILPIKVKKVLYLSNNVRLVDDVGELWEQAFASDDDPFSLDDILAIQSTDARTCEPNVDCRRHDMFGMYLARMRLLPQEFTLSSTSSQADLDEFLSFFQDRITVKINCSWAVQFTTGFEFSSCLPVKGIIWTSSSAYSFSGINEVETAKELVQLISKSYLENTIRRLSSSHCQLAELPKSRRVVVANTAPRPGGSSSAPECEEFRRVARLKRRTHPFFIVVEDLDKSNVTEGQTLMSGTGVDVTLATQLAINRFGALEIMLKTWDGPASVTFHVTDEEAERLPTMISDSSVLRNRTLVSYHVVYKRLLFNPINYLRNVAVNRTFTQYLFYVDIDLIPNVGIYEQMKTWIQRLVIDEKRQSRNIALVIPSFASESMIEVPANKTGLLNMIKQNQVVGFSMNRKWNGGHRPTNFTRWMSASEPYYVDFQDEFEPYIVIRTASSPQYNELLMERFADKAAYVRTLHAKGFKLCVLPDVFILHLPHPMSDVYKLYKAHRHFSRCTALMSKEFKADLSARFPNVTF